MPTIQRTPSPTAQPIPRSRGLIVPDPEPHFEILLSVGDGDSGEVHARRDLRDMISECDTDAENPQEDRGQGGM